MTFMKKAVSFLLTLLMLMSCLMVTAFAGESVSYTVKSSPSEVKADDTVTVTVCLDSAMTAFGGLDFALDFDTDALELVSATEGEYLDVVVDTETAGKVCFSSTAVAFITGDSLPADAVLLTVVFTVKDGASGNISPEMNVDVSFDIKSNRYDVTVNQATITVCEHTNTKLVDNENGTHRVVCADCDAVVIESQDHTYDTWTPCSDDNTKHQGFCACGNTVTQDHTFAYTNNDTYGKHTKYCPQCDYNVAEDCHGGTATCLSPAICDVCKEAHGSIGNHDCVKTSAKTPTCTEPGNNEYYTCSVCKTVFEADKITETTVTAETLQATDHNWGDWVEVEAATEEHPGSKQRVCQNDSNHIETQPIPQLPHTHVFGEMISEVPATCTANGIKAHKTCTKCNLNFDADDNEITNLTIPATGHDYADQPWVTDGESHWHVCKNCNTEIDTKVAHSSTGDNVATCTAKAHCDVCGVEYGNVNAKNHKLPDNWTSTGKNTHVRACERCYLVVENERCSGGTANCVDKAVCEVCNQAYGQVNANNHRSPVTTGDKVATCTTPGQTGTGHCNACNQDIKQSEEIPALGHQYGAPTFTWAEDYSSCKATFTCTREGCTEQQENHAVTVGCTVTSETTPSTCKDAGKTVYTATVSFAEYKDGEECKDTKTDDLPPVDHTYGNEIPEVPATCTENGTKAHFECSVCGKLFVLDGERYAAASAEDLVIPATGHDWGDWNVTKEATSTEEGSQTRVCKNDKSHTETKAIAKLPVDPVKPTDPTKPATGDAGVGVWVALLSVSALLGTAIVVKKRHA